MTIQISKLRKSKTFKGLCVLVAFNFLFEVISPTAVFGLTGGPSQPEVQSFQPVTTTEMVNLATGDFNYNIPLLNVPGPNGGYPINLHYQSDIGMEQEASWVGLGWNINVGAITRNMRGLPDDFNGDGVDREMNIRPNQTFTLGTSPSGFEVFGATLQATVSGQYYYNNYKGFGTRAYLTLSQNTGESCGNEALGPSGSLQLGFDSQEGLTASPSLSFRKQINNSYHAFNGGVTFHSRQGFSNIHLGHSLYGYDEISHTTDEHGKQYTSRAYHQLAQRLGGPGVSFANKTAVPSVNHAFIGASGRFNIEVGPANSDGTWQSNSINLIGSYDSQWLPESEKSFTTPAYGAMYSRNNTTGGRFMMDFNRENERAITKRTPNLPVPVMTTDYYSVVGQGIGTTFRAYRNDIGVLHNNGVQSSSTSADFTRIEASDASSSEIKVGVDASVTFSNSYSGQWRDHDEEINGIGSPAALGFKPKSMSAPSYEDFYFKSAGEMTASDQAPIDNIKGDAPVKFDLSLAREGLFLTPYVHNRVQDSPDYGIEDSKIEERQRRVQSIQHRTIEEITSSFDYNKRPEYLFGQGSQAAYPFYDYQGATGQTIDYDTDFESQIGSISIVNPDGNIYSYDLPAYNHSQTDVVFTPHEGNIPGPNNPNETDFYKYPRTIDYNATSASVDNQNGQDHYYSRTTIPDYAHSHLLTNIVSTDYVDLTGNGPSDDDMGYFCKFNYTKEHDDYQWRIPYAGANYTKGYYSNYTDDKASYNHGTKDIYYLNSIETKTHIAIFILDDREDAAGAGAEEKVDDGTPNPTAGKRQKRLKEIRLYSKNDGNEIDQNTGLPLATPIKTVHFTYEYTLCPNVPNNVNYVPLNSPNNPGKLTLTHVHFTYLGNEKGELSPYVFTYDNNFPYDQLQMDRWGNYLPDDAATAGQERMNIENPYVPQGDLNGDNVVDAQDKALRDAWAAAWCMTKIDLPSGGTINIEYESDDYSFVQDKRAMQMSRIVGTSKENTTDPDPGNRAKLGKNYTRIYFEMENAGDDPMEYLDGIEELYFKTWQRLKNDPYLSGQDEVFDYVDGYCHIDRSKPIGVSFSNNRYGYFSVEQLDYKVNAVASLKAHPFRMAGWQYLRFSRPDLFQAPTTPVDLSDGILNEVIENYNVFLEASNLLYGYYNTAAVRGLSKEIKLDQKPSYVRVNSADYTKYGGGCRVSQLTMTDNWAIDKRYYGQKYSYTNINGTSSGIAEYEPLIGGEEIPHRIPIRFDGSDQIIPVNKIDAYIEAPLGESYFPAANVVYGRVTVQSIVPVDIDEISTPLGINDNGVGISVNEFYTAKDFPVIVESTATQAKGFPVPIPIPLLGARTFNNYGYSQGYSIQLNDMHGKPKSVATYPNGTDFLNDPVVQATSEVRYRYHTDPENGKKLESNVPVAFADGLVRTAPMGRTQDFFVDMNENSNITRTFGTQFNVRTNPASAGVVVPTVFPIVEHAESMNRTVVTNKIIYRNGILKETQAFSEGAFTKTQNLIYDAETGVPVLSELTNEFGKSVYNYNYCSYWNYDGMKPAYHNIGMKFDIEEIGGGFYELASLSGNASQYLFPGDELIETTGNARRRFYVTSVNGTQFQLETEDGAAPSLAGAVTIKVDRSGYRNQQGIPVGSIVSLTHPIDDRTFPLFDEYNANNGAAAYTFEYCDGTQQNVQASIVGNVIQFQQLDQCIAEIEFPTSQTPSALADYTLKKEGQLVRITEVAPNGQVFFGTWTEEDGCYPECLDGVLHADAVELRDNVWTYNYTDVGQPQVDIGNGDEDLDNTIGNDYRFGRLGIWRVLRNNVFQVDRNAFDNGTKDTELDKDGTYEHFTVFNWFVPSANDNEYKTNEVGKDWQWASLITKYNPFGFALEQRDALGVYGSQMYGYNNSTVTATASNSDYQEMAYDGFEDYGVNGYTGTGHGHLNLQPVLGSGQINLSQLQSHTGRESVILAPGDVIAHSEANGSNYFNPNPTVNGIPQDKKYHISLWVYRENSADDLTITIGHGSGATLATIDVASADGVTIEGWKRVEAEFTYPTANNGSFDIDFQTVLNNQGNVFIDDIRIHPHKGAMMSYVYDPNLLWLKAELDNRNFATLYSYDEEGSLIQVKKETYNGLITLQTARSNTAQ